MAGQDPDLLAAITEAVNEAGGAVINDGTASPATVATPVAGEQPSTGTDPEPPEAPAETTIDSGTAGEPPEAYWGVSLEGLSPEKRAEIIGALEQRDSTIHKLQAKLTAPVEPGEQPVPEPVVAVDDIPDDELLVAAGYDPEDYEVQRMARFILPGLRRELKLEDQLHSLVEKETVREVETSWNTALDELETTHGKLPLDRVQVLRFAIDNQLASPFETYFRIAAPIRVEVESAVQKARLEAAREAAGAGLRPGSSTAGPEVIKPEMTLREAVEAAAMAAEKETGKSWKSVFSKRG
jgi:hypothetical protein